MKSIVVVNKLLKTLKNPVISNQESTISFLGLSIIVFLFFSAL